MITYPVHQNSNSELKKSADELKQILEESVPSLCMLPILEKIINKQDPTLEEILDLCSHNDSLLSRLTRRSGVQGTVDEFAKAVLFNKGLGFLKSLAIRTMIHEMFDFSINSSDETAVSLKRRSIILARFAKSFCKDLSMEPDLAYFSGLFYQFNYVAYFLLNPLDREDGSFERDAQKYSVITGGALASFGFNETVCNIVFDSRKNLHDTYFPFFHALTRIGLGLLLNSESSYTRSSRSRRPNRELLDATGLKERKIVNKLREISKNYNGT